MRRTIIMGVLTLLTACSEANVRGDNTATPPAPEAFPAYPEKVLPYVDDPALSAEDQQSCVSAGGEWAETYELGVLYSREPFAAKYYGDHPEDALKTHGKQCWSTREPVTYADGGKPCSGQSDCEMNCIAREVGNGRFDMPKCQASELDQPNCEYIFDGGKYLPTACAIP